MTINPDGSYSAHCQFVDNLNTVRTFDIQGTDQVQNGWLIETMTSHSMVTNKERLPVRNTNQIVQLTDDQLILNYGTTNGPLNAIFRKEGK